MPKLIHSSCSGVLFIKERGIPGYDLSVGPGRSGPGGYYTGVRQSLIKELNFSGAKTPKVFYTHATKTILKHYGLAGPTLLQRYIVSFCNFDWSRNQSRTRIFQKGIIGKQILENSPRNFSEISVSGA